MKRVLCAGIAIAASLGAALPCAQADDVQVTGSILPGHLGISSSPTRVALPRGKKARVAAALQVPFVITDSRGSGAGWAVALTAIAKTARGRAVHGLSVTVHGFKMHCRACRKPVDKLDYPIALPLGKPTRVFRAGRNSGMGVIDLSAQLTVAGTPKPATGGLRLTVHLAQVSGP